MDHENNASVCLRYLIQKKSVPYGVGKPRPNKQWSDLVMFVYVIGRRATKKILK